ncbi:hypothetical protein Dda_0873 [Drechslerella dactyloides]|uniref:Uncharacterized protein n=1 Tax=Drechslerella dactyloides TaxID=74499 RepID=A0AAD6J562_DREDA|nr:hypothetical protein Dda_0873 [Drechslerella dactyloides]
MSDTSASASTATPSRPSNRNKHSKSSPQVPTTQKKNNKGPRRSNGINLQTQPRQESALTKKFREAAQIDNGTASDSGVGAILEKGLVTPPATPGPSGRKEPIAYVSDSALGSTTDGSNKRKNNNKKRRGRRPTEIATNVLQSITPPQETINTPPDDIMFGKPTPSKAYAGACFHDASPAPNALPLPKFFSKSVPTSSDGPSLSKMLAEAEAAGPSTADSPPPTAPLPTGTPLDIFFKADKEEKARKAMEQTAKNEILSPKPTATPSTDNRTLRNLTPPSAAIQTGLGSPFGGRLSGRDENDADRDLLFSMDFSDSKKPAPRPTEEIVQGPRYRPLSFLAQDVESLVRRQEKAKELKDALMTQLASPKVLEFNEPPSPSPKGKPNANDFMGSDAPLSPTIHDRRARTNNVGFAPAPRIRHFHQNRPVNPRSNGQQYRGPKNQVYNSPSQNPFQPRPHHMQPQHHYDPVRARIGESHIRGVLKLDAPISAN